MARLSPRKELITLIGKFSEKNSISEFKKLDSDLKEEMRNYSGREKLKGGEYEKKIGELAILDCITDEYTPSHVQYTGGNNSSKDGILYFNEEEQNVEITSITDEEQIKSYRKTRSYSLMTLPAICRIMEEYGYSESQARKALEAQSMGNPLIEDFLYEKIVSALEKKNKEKYKNFWLLMAYSPFFYTEYLSDEKIRKYVLEKIESEKTDLIFSIKKVFKKVIFVPYNKESGNHKVFEWRI